MTKKAKKVKAKAAKQATRAKVAKFKKKQKGAAGSTGSGSAIITTFKPNGGTAQQIPDTKIDLGELQLPEPDQAVAVLRELADLNDKAIVAGKRYEDLKSLTKTAKDTYDTLAAQVLSRLQQATHKSDLPLFADIEQRERDQRAMESQTGAIVDPAVDQIPEAPVTDAGQDAAETASGEAGEAIGASDAVPVEPTIEDVPAAPLSLSPSEELPQPVLDDDVPF